MNIRIIDKTGKLIRAKILAFQFARINETSLYLIYGFLIISNTKNLDKMSPFLSILFELLITFSSFNEEKSIFELYLLSIAKCWTNISDYILNELLIDKEKNKLTKHKYLSDESCQNFNQLFLNGLQFYSIYLSKLTQLKEQSKTINILFENITYLFDTTENCTEENNTVQTLGVKLCEQLIKQFDKCYLIETNQNLKLIVSNLMKTLLAISESAKKTALNGIVKY